MLSEAATAAATNLGTRSLSFSCLKHAVFCDILPADVLTVQVFCLVTPGHTRRKFFIAISEFTCEMTAFSYANTFQ